MLKSLWMKISGQKRKEEERRKRDEKRNQMNRLIGNHPCYPALKTIVHLLKKMKNDEIDYNIGEHIKIKTEDGKATLYVKPNYSTIEYSNEYGQFKIVLAGTRTGRFESKIKIKEGMMEINLWETDIADEIFKELENLRWDSRKKERTEVEKIEMLKKEINC